MPFGDGASRVSRGICVLAPEGRAEQVSAGDYGAKEDGRLDR